MVTISVIKADIGGMVGHSSSHPDILALGQRELFLSTVTRRIAATTCS
jgi:fructose 1,6-bisphosphatase